MIVESAADLCDNYQARRTLGLVRAEVNFLRIHQCATLVGMIAATLLPLLLRGDGEWRGEPYSSLAKEFATAIEPTLPYCSLIFGNKQRAENLLNLD